MYLKMKSEATENCDSIVDKISRLSNLMKKEPEEIFKKKTDDVSKTEIKPQEIKEVKVLDLW